MRMLHYTIELEYLNAIIRVASDYLNRHVNHICFTRSFFVICKYRKRYYVLKTVILNYNKCLLPGFINQYTYLRYYFMLLITWLHVYMYYLATRALAFWFK